ncbi:MAG TPA: GGDEF domain-containing protein [Actinomycetota bacterium]|nr:GGDEF domain-containing protein [Actinomycetota bacterium]
MNPNVSRHTSESPARELASPRGSRTLGLLGITDDDLVLAQGDELLLETLRSTHDLLHALQNARVLDVFLQLPDIDRTSFLRWIASSNDLDVRRSRTRSFVTALTSSPLTEQPAADKMIDLTGSPQNVQLVDPPRIGEERDRIADVRDITAEGRDEAARIRDERARTRDHRANVRERTSGVIDTGAAGDRAGASRDRSGSLRDRNQASEDRFASAVDRRISARERALSSIDDLTGAFRRDAGRLALDRELAMAKRTGRTMVVAFVDVDGLKETNDSSGHALGDVRLRETVRTIRRHLRSYDLIVRYGGDEFVCALAELDPATAAERFIVVNSDLVRDGHGSITVGLAEMRPDDSLDALIERADKSLYSNRG